MKNQTRFTPLRWGLPFTMALTLVMALFAFTPTGTAMASEAYAPASVGLMTAYNTITIDGDMSDWSPDELMESDATKDLYITWDADNLYIGFVGTNWNGDGDLFIYLDTIPGGTTTSIDWSGTHTLSFEADYVFAIENGYYNLRYYDGVSWQTDQPYNGQTFIGWSGDTDTEISFPWGDIASPIANLHVLVFSQWENQRNVWASWPTPNPASGTDISETFTHFYHFPSLVNGSSPHDAVLADHILINEFRPKGTGGEQVEIYNPLSITVDLTGWYLDDVVCGSGTSFLATTILPGGYFIVNPSDPGDNYDLENSGDLLYLCDNNNIEIDRVGYGNVGGAPLANSNGDSVARTPNGTDSDNDAGDWNFESGGSYGSANSAPIVLLGSSVVFNEFDNYPTSGNDMLEIFNPTTNTITLTGWIVSDGDYMGPIVTNKIVPPGSWVVLEETVDWTTPSLDFSSTDVGYLIQPDGIRVDQIGWTGEYEDDTFQRIDDGQGPNDGYDWASSGGGVTWFDLPSTLGSTNNIADVQIVKSGVSIISPGELLTYTVSYNNSGPGSAQSVTISDTLPTGVTYVSNDSGLPCPACIPGATGDLLWIVDTMASGTGDTFNLVVQVDTGLSAGTLLINNIAIATTTTDTNYGNNQSQVMTSVSTIDLSVQKTGRNYITADSQLVYTIAIDNSGIEQAQNVVLTDTLPFTTAYVNDNSGFTPTNPNPGMYVWSLGDILTNTTFTFQLTVTVSATATPGTLLTNDAIVSTTTPNDPPNNNTDQHTTAVILPIHDIQGAAHISLYSGQPIQTAGIVTVVRYNGFYLQDPYADADDATSEAIYVYTGSNPGRNVGDEVLVSGTVTEYRPGATGLAFTEISSPVVTLLSTDNALPAATILGNGGRIPPNTIISDDAANGDVEDPGTIFDPANDGIDFYESLEGMLVQINDAIAVAPTNYYGEITVVGDDGANATIISPRGGNVIQDGDFNPERILVDDSIISNEPQVTTGATFDAPIIGVMDYTFGNFKLFNTIPLEVTDSSLPQEVTSLAAGPDQIMAATFNVYNLDPSDGTRFGALAQEIVNNLGAPDIIGLEEIQDNNGEIDDGTVDASQTYQELIDAITSIGGPAYEYRDIAPENNMDGGAPGGNIRVGFLFRTDRGLSFVDRPGGDATTATTVTLGVTGVEFSFSPGRVDPTNAAFDDSRKPLAGEFTFNDRKLFVIVNHFNSKGGDDALFGRFQPPVLYSEVQRLQQAQVVNDFVDDILALDPTALVVVLGDLNDFQFSNPLETLKGDVLNNLIETLPPEEQYTYIYDGNSQVLDHILVSDALLDLGSQVDVVHVNAEFLFDNQASDHDPVLALLNMPQASVRFSAADLSVGEGDTNATITVTLDASTMVTITVDYATSDGTALGGMDYTSVTGTLTFTPGETTQTFSVPILDDALFEGDETVMLVLSNPVSATLGSPYSATLTIVDNDIPPAVQFSAADFSVGEGEGNASITVTLDNPAGVTVTVDYASSDGTAIGGMDYTLVTGTLTFVPGETNQTFSVPILDDAIYEGDETILIGLSNPEHATLGSPSNATLTIVEDDPQVITYTLYLAIVARE